MSDPPLRHRAELAVRRSLIGPVPRDHHESDGALTRRRVVVVVTLVVGAVISTIMKLGARNDADHEL